MQLFRCPFCGAREESEFHFASEAGKHRPEPASSVDDATWSAYLYENVAPKGEAREIWLHVTCGEYSIMHRDTVTRAVLSVEELPGRKGQDALSQERSQ